MRTYPLSHVIRYAREHSPFYRELYAGLGPDPSLEELPLIVQGDFWKSMEETPPLVPTGEHIDGHVFRSGGTTGKPKYTLYAADEWRAMCELTGLYLPLSGLERGDRVANLFYGGDMYASFLYFYSTHYFSPSPVVLFSLSGNMPPEYLAEALLEHRITVVAGVPSLMMKLMEYIGEHKMQGLCISTIYFAGETLFPDQRRKICQILGRDIAFRSAGYASNDGGIIGYYHRDCGFNEHRTMDLACRLELVDPDTGEVIRELGRPGKIYVTSLYRLLMPIIRYPAGDMAEYVDPEGVPDRRFRLLGRSEEAARVGYVGISPEDISEALRDAAVPFDGLQLVLTHQNGRDGLTVRIAASTAQPERNDHILEKIYARRPLLQEATNIESINTTRIEWKKHAELEHNARTGKCLRIVDQRPMR